jgi:hypothetical protein
MHGHDLEALATCESCARLFKEKTRHYYCSTCERYYFVCRECAKYGPHCRFCGASLKKRTEIKKYVPPRKKSAAAR